MEEIREAMETIVTPEAPAEWWEGTSFEDAKAIIRSNMASMARDSVAIGYYLRSIRDKQQYLDGGYQSFDAFVQAEYSMSYSAASRLIGLCERFSRGGNSPVLADSYQGYSKSLLVEMLPMSDEQLEQVQPGMTVAEVREVKRAAQAMPEPDPELPAEEPEVVFQLAGETEETSRQEVVERLEAVMPAPVFEAEDEEELLCDECANASALTGNPDSCANCGPEGRGYSPLRQEEPAGCAHDRAGACTEMVLSDPDVVQPCVEGPCPAEGPVATSQLPACIMGYAESGVCGAAAYCGQPYRCCLQCDEDCNGRCGWIPKQEAIPEPEAEQKSEPKRNPAMETQARMCLSNLQVEIGAKAWPAALASARHLVHYLSLVVGEEEK